MRQSPPPSGDLVTGARADEVSGLRLFDGVRANALLLEAVGFPAGSHLLWTAAKSGISAPPFQADTFFRPGEFVTGG